MNSLKSIVPLSSVSNALKASWPRLNYSINSKNFVWTTEINGGSFSWIKFSLVRPDLIIERKVCLAEHLSVSTGKDLVVHRQEHSRGELTWRAVSYKSLIPVLAVRILICHPLSSPPTSIILSSNWVLLTRNLIVSLLSLDLVGLFPILQSPVFRWKYFLNTRTSRRVLLYNWDMMIFRIVCLSKLHFSFYLLHFN